MIKYLELMAYCEGAGLSRNSKELFSSMNSISRHSIKVIANADYKNDKVHSFPKEFEWLSFSNDSSKIKAEIDECDILLIVNTPKSSDIDSHKTFIDLVKHANENKKLIVYLQYTHLNVNYNREVANVPSLKPFLKYVDVIVTHSEETSMKYAWKEFHDIDLITIDDDLYNDFAISFNDLKNAFWKDYSEKEYKSIRYLGRAVRRKGPWLVRDVHSMKNGFKDNGYITYIEGIDRSIGILNELYVNRLAPKIERDDTIVTFKSKDILTKYANGELKYERNKPAYILPPFANSDGMKHVSASMFGIELLSMKPKYLKACIENVMLEYVAVGTIPVFSKSWGENFMLAGKRIIDYDLDKAGIILLDPDNPEEAIKKMNELADDKKKYDKFRNNAYSFFFKHFDSSIIYPKLIARIDEKIETKH